MSLPRIVSPLVLAALSCLFLVAAPVAEKAGIRNLYYGSAAMLLAIGAIGYYKLTARAASPAAEAD